MRGSVDEPPTSSDELRDDARRFGRRARVIVVAFAVLCAIGLCMPRKSQPAYWRLADGRKFQILNWDRHTQITMSSAVVPESASYYFWVRYITSTHDPDSMATEARELAPLLYRIADSLGFSKLHLDPTYRVSSGVLPNETFSLNLVFERGADGRWIETDHLPRAKGD